MMKTTGSLCRHIPVTDETIDAGNEDVDVASHTAARAIAAEMRNHHLQFVGIGGLAKMRLKACCECARSVFGSRIGRQSNRGNLSSSDSLRINNVLIIAGARLECSKTK